MYYIFYYIFAVVYFYYKTKQQLDDHGIEYQAKSYPNLGHSISQDELDDLIIFLENL